MVNIQVDDFAQLKAATKLFSDKKSPPAVLYTEVEGEFTIAVVTEQAFISHKFETKPQGFDQSFTDAVKVAGIAFCS